MTPDARPRLESDGRILGHLAVLDTRTLPPNPHIEGVFRLFADRATAELRRLRVRVFAFAVGLVLVTTITFGLLPAWVASRQAMHVVLKISGASVVRGSRFSLRQALLVLQVAFAVTLTATAGLYYGSLRRMLAVDSGLPTDRLLLGTYRAGSLSEQEGGRFSQRLVERLRAHPEVQAAAATINEPYLIGRAEVEVPGREDSSRLTIGMTAVSPGFFDTLRIPLLAGRPYDVSDPAGGVALIINHGRICWQRLKINLSHVFAGQNVGVKQVSDRIWLVSFLKSDLGYFDDETCRLEPIENPCRPKLLPM